MFTGLVEEIGIVNSSRQENDNLVLEISAPKMAQLLKRGDSININGACQTVIAGEGDWFRVNTIAESLRKTNLGYLRIGDSVNLEPALRPDSRLGGHIVSGHIDCVGIIKSIHQISGSWEVNISFPAEFADLIVAKGSIAISGVSLTVTHCAQDDFGVSLIPHTWEMTTFPSMSVGDKVNLEFDLIGKYISRMIDPYKDKKSSLSSESLRRAGF